MNMSIDHQQENSRWSIVFIIVAGMSVVLRLVIWKFFAGADTIVKEDLGNLIVAGSQLLAGIVYGALAITGRVKLRTTGFEWPLGLMAATSFVSIWYSCDFSMSIRVWIPLLGCISLFYILANTLTSVRRIRYFLYFLLGLALLTSFYGIQEYFYLTARQTQPGDSAIAQYNNSLYYILVNRRVTSFLGWPNSLAGYLGLILPFCGFSVLMVKPVWLKVILSLVFGALVSCLLVTFSFLGWLSFLLAGLILLPTMIKKLLPQMRPSLKITFFVLAGILLALFVVVIFHKNFLGSLQPRVEYYSQAWHLLMKNPWWGYGYGTFGIAARSMVETQTGLTNFVHNSYLQWWVECGITGFAGIISLVMMFVLLVRRVFNAFVEGEANLIAIAVVWGVTAFFVDNLFSFTFVKPNIAVHGWAVLAVFAALWMQARGKRVETSSVIPAGAGVLVCLMSLAAATGLSIALFYYHNGAIAFRAGNLDGAGRAFVAGSMIDRWSSMYPAAAGDAAIRVYQASQKEYFLRMAEANYLEAVRREPLQYAPQLMLSRIYTAVGQGDSALLYGREARRLSPYEYSRDMLLAAQNTPSDTGK